MYSLFPRKLIFTGVFCLSNSRVGNMIKCLYFLCIWLVRVFRLVSGYGVLFIGRSLSGSGVGHLSCGRLVDGQTGFPAGVGVGLVLFGYFSERYFTSKQSNN